MKEVSEEMNESKTCLRFSQRLPYQPALHTQAPAVKVYKGDSITFFILPLVQ